MRRVWQQAELPVALQNMVCHLTEKLVVVLVLHGRAFPPVYLYTGLRQGCPLSCIVYVIIVDPFLEHVARRQGVDARSGHQAGPFCVEIEAFEACF